MALQALDPLVVLLCLCFPLDPVHLFVLFVLHLWDLGGQVSLDSLHMGGRHMTEFLVGSNCIEYFQSISWCCLECSITAVLPYLGSLDCQGDLGFLWYHEYSVLPFLEVLRDRMDHVDLGFLDHLSVQELLQQIAQGHLVLHWDLLMEIKLSGKINNKSKFRFSSLTLWEQQ